MMRLSAVVVAWAVALTAPPLVHAKEILVKGGILVEESYQNLFYQTTASPLEGRRLQDDQIPIVDVIARAFILRDVEAYLGVGQLVPEISVTGPITFFPVWDTGFERFDADLILKLQDRSRKWSGHVRDLMQYHLYEGDLSPELLTASQTVVMANGEEMTLTQDGAGRIFANGIRQIAPYNATNGYAYMLQDVLRPAWLNRNLLATVATSALPTLASLLVTTDLDGALSNPDAALTVFAPSEQAFADLGDALLNYLQSPDGLATLTDILLYHVVDDLLPTLRLPAVSTPVPTLANGAELLLVPGTPYMVNGLTNTARITTPDMFARNGVLHIIDNVLLFGSILPSLVEIVATQPALSDLGAALAASGDDIANALSGAGPFLLLAPTNAALAAMDTQLAAVLFSEAGWLAHLQSFLLLHVTTQVGTTGELVGTDTTFVMLSGEAVRARGNPLVLSPSFGFPCNVETADFRGLNGYVSTITRALAPSWSTESLFDVMETSTTMMASFLEAADLATTLRAERDLMVSRRNRGDKVYYSGGTTTHRLCCLFFHTGLCSHQSSLYGSPRRNIGLSRGRRERWCPDLLTTKSYRRRYYFLPKHPPRHY
jgi:transforming growth factor-beta-induced protein